jgi:oxygen-independent coproporphyrinogen-3 oxidase
MTLGIYIQVPFCQTKCTYCNFHTGVFSKTLYSPYVEAVCREISERGGLNTTAVTANSTVDTVYIGGGTPSLLEPTAMARMLEAIRSQFDCELEEVTLEADPETITPEKADIWASAGINRISMGVQSFHDAELQAAGRMHRRADIYRATRVLREAGFRNLSFDLIAGLPKQAAVTWESSLDELLALRPEHISIYLMEIDEGSRLGKEALAGGTRYSASLLPDEDSMAMFYESACERLAPAGYEHYEISNWGLPGMHSRHNLKYWRRERYLGFGAGAHSFDGRQRWANAHDPAAYVLSIQNGRLPTEQHEVVSEKQALEEEFFLGLRQLAGIDLTELEARYHVDYRARLQGLAQAGLVEFDGSRVRLAPSRLTVSNAIFVELLG